MIRFTRLLALAATAILVAGCITTRVPPEKLEGIKTVAVVTDFDDEIHQFFYGLLAFDTEHFTANVSDWNTNDYVFTKLGEHLGTRYRIVRGGKIDRSAYQINKWTDNAADRGEKSFATIRDKNPEADAYLLFIPDTKVNIAATVSWPVDSLGLMRASLAMRMPWAKYHQYAVYAAYDLFLIDARSGKLIAFRSGERIQGSGGSMYELPTAYIEISDDWPKDLPSVLASHRPEVEKRMKDLLDRSLRQTVQDMGLLAQP
ncbi:hypothetical protein [Ferrovibrio sp.]|uniref:hypothetical protein n=1 Tax=Ferrovibrio sp. TaxID=1917215 RepID=UPI0035B419F2